MNTKKWAQCELSPLLFIAKTYIKGSTIWATFSIAYSGFVIGNGTH